MKWVWQYLIFFLAAFFGTLTVLFLFNSFVEFKWDFGEFAIWAKTPDWRTAMLVWTLIFGANLQLYYNLYKYRHEWLDEFLDGSWRERQAIWKKIEGMGDRE